LKHMVANNMPAIKAAKRTGKVFYMLKVCHASPSHTMVISPSTTNKDEDFPRAFDGQTREQIEALKPSARIPLLLNAELF